MLTGVNNHLVEAKKDQKMNFKKDAPKDNSSKNIEKEKRNQSENLTQKRKPKNIKGNFIDISGSRHVVSKSGAT